MEDWHIEDVCRTCFIKQSDPKSFHNLFVETAANLNIRELLAFLKLNINKNDGMPQQICDRCHRKFIDFDDFQKKCKLVQETLSTLKLGIKKEELDESVAIENINISIESFDVGHSQDDFVEDFKALGNVLNEDPLKKDYEENQPNSGIETNDNDSETSFKEGYSKWECYTNAENVDVKSTEIVPKKREGKRKHEQKIEVRERNEICKFCKKKFVVVTHHQRFCSERNVEICKYCFGEIPTVDELKTHIDEKHPDKLPSCPICFASFESLGTRNTHVSKSHNEGKYRCEMCNYDYRSKNNLRKHNRKAHAEEINRPCPVCQKVCSTQRKYDYHMKTHDPEGRKYQCKFCDKSFVQATHLQNHERIHTGERPHLCNVCGKSFRYLYEIRNHLKMKHGESLPIRKPGPQRDITVTKYQCTTCNKILGTLQSFYTHRRAHMNIFPYVCSNADCGKRFKYKSALDKHTLFDHNTEGNSGSYYTFSCKSCSKGFRSACALETHIKMHDENRPYRCESCSSSFKRREHLTSHVKRIHVKDKKFACPHCDKKFVERGELNGHMVCHSDEKPFECSYCSMAFKRKSDLTVHLRKHTGEKNHRCLVCQKLFSTSQELGLHYAKHSDVETKFIEELILEGLDRTSDRD